MTDAIKYVIIARACDTEGYSVEAKVGMTELPRQGSIHQVREAIVALFRMSFGHEPGRVGVVHLPYIEDADADAVGEVGEIVS
jgi:hypothetical protein